MSYFKTLPAIVLLATLAATPADAELRNVGRDICRSLKLKCTSHHAAHRAPLKHRTSTKRKAPVKSKSLKAVKSAPVTVVQPAPPPPLPRRKPSQPVTIATAPPVIEPPPSLPKVSTPSDAGCIMRLKSLGLTFEMSTPPPGAGLCQIDDAVQLRDISFGQFRITFPDRPLLNCKFAARFAEWLSQTGAPIVLAQTKSPVAAMSTGPGYECRGRNGDSSAKTSEHGFGNAVDITAFKLADGRVFQIKDAINAGSPAYATLQGLRGSACGYFTTVLGPGSNAAHAGHFHFDLGKHGKSDTYKICE